jgi:disulfide oxidoreductase YuzD
MSVFGAKESCAQAVTANPVAKTTPKTALLMICSPM